MEARRIFDDGHIQEVLDLAMRLGEVLLFSGESAAATTETMLRTARVAGLRDCAVDITLTSITMCYHRGSRAAPLTTMRLVHHRTLDLSRLNAAVRLAGRVQQGGLAPAAAADELDKIVRAPHPYRRWVATAGWAGMAGSVAALLGGGVGVIGVAVGVTALIDRVGRTVNRYGLPPFFQQVLGGLLATVTTVALLATGLLGPGTVAPLVVAAAMTVLLSGLSLVGTVRDAISGYYVTAAGRSVEVAISAAGLLAGVVLGLQADAAAGVGLQVAAEVRGGGPVAVRVVAAGLVAGCFALAGYAPARFIAVAALVGATGFGAYTLGELAGLGPVTATGFAAVAVGVGAALFHRLTGGPQLVVTLAGITPLLPGFTAYRGTYQLAVQGSAEGVVTVMLALVIGLALAAGVVLGEWFVSRLIP